MRKRIFIVGLFLTVLVIFSHAQAPQKDFNKRVALNPNADRDLQLTADYSQAVLVDGNLSKARTFLAPDAWSHGPGAKDSSTVDEVLKTWEKNYVTNLDRKINFTQMTWRVLEEGYFKGDWVAHWGIYSYTDRASGKRMDIPYHTVAKIVNGKISNNWSYYDLLGIMLQSGFTLQPPHTNP